MKSTRRPISRQVTATQLIERHCADILSSPGMDVERRCIQHGTTSIFAHSWAVTIRAIEFAQDHQIPVNERSLVRGTLLHDYFLYDWHVPDPSHRLHGYRHPGFACKNAVRDFGISPLEQSMVRHHMWPLTPTPPTCREGWILCLADKQVATRETAAGFARKLRLRQEDRANA